MAKKEMVYEVECTPAEALEQFEAHMALAGFSPSGPQRRSSIFMSRSRGCIDLLNLGPTDTVNMVAVDRDGETTLHVEAPRKRTREEAEKIILEVLHGSRIG